MRNMNRDFLNKECPSNFYKKVYRGLPFKATGQVDLDIITVGHKHYRLDRLQYDQSLYCLNL